MARIPLPRGIIYSTNNSTLLTDPKRYRRLIGHLLYLNLTRPDISFVVQQLSQFVNTSCQKHCDAAIHILLILEIVRQTTFLFFNNNVSIIAYCNVDWVQPLYLGKLKKQSTVSRSSTEAEYRNGFNSLPLQ